MKKYTNFAIMAIFALAVTILPEIAMALDGIIGGTLCEISDMATGQTGKAIATLAVVFVGLGAFFGKANWGLVLITAMGIALVFGSATIANMLNTAGEGDAC